VNLKAIIRTYPIDKPKPSIQLIFLAVITVCGLAALFFAAFASFRISTGNIAQAAFAALLIEVGLAAEAFALIKRPKSLYPWVGLLIAFFVSGTYNWYQAEMHTKEAVVSISNVTLFALAFGPLSALAFVSLTLGNEIREYQNAVGKWQTEAMGWAVNERKRLERAEKRAESKRKTPENNEQLPENLPENSGKQLPQWVTVEPQSIGHFRELVGDGTIVLPPGLTGKDLTVIDSVRDDRTGRNWLQAVEYRQMTNGRH
jgi:hypothetical protein